MLRLPPPHRARTRTRGEIGIPRVLNMYENYPFWFTLLTALGFKRDDLRPFQPRPVRDRHGIHPLRERLLPGQARPRPHQMASRQGHQDDLLPLRRLRAEAHAESRELTSTARSWRPIPRSSATTCERRGGARCAKLMQPLRQLRATASSPARPHPSKTFKEYGYDIPVEEMKAALRQGLREEDAAPSRPTMPREGRRNALAWHARSTACAASCSRAAPTTSTPRSTTASPKPLLAGHGGTFRGFHLRTAAGRSSTSPNSFRKASHPASEERRRIPPRRRPHSHQDAVARHSTSGPTTRACTRPHASRSAT